MIPASLSHVNEVDKNLNKRRTTFVKESKTIKEAREDSLTASNLIVVKRMRKMCLFGPDSTFKSNWDLFITIILIFSCMLTPYRIAFVDEEK